MWWGFIPRRSSTSWLEAFRPISRFLFEFCNDGFGLRASRRRRYYSFRLIINWICIAIFIVFGVYLIARQQSPNQEILSFITKILHRSKYIHIPSYLLLDIDDHNEFQCKQIFQHPIPNIDQMNLTNKNLVRSLFDNKVSLAYLTHTDINQTISITQAKLCSNKSNEWILFTILEKETISQDIDHSLYASESLSNQSRIGERCEPFNFDKCSLRNLQNDYPRLFQFSYEQHIKAIQQTSSSFSNEIAYVVYHYTRRKAADYIQYKNRIKDITSVPYNLTIIPKVIEYQHIVIAVELYQNVSSVITTDCFVNLVNGKINRTQLVQMANLTILFDSLQPLTTYNICINCQTTNTVCKQVKTKPSSSFQSDSDLSRARRYQETFILVPIIVFLVICIVTMATRSIISMDSNEVSFFEDTENTVALLSYTQIEDITTHNLADATNTGSVSTITGRSVQEVFGSISSIDSMCLNPQQI